jgi:hypothetical protein
MLLLVLAATGTATSGARAQDSSSLTLQVYVCPADFSPNDLWIDCGGRVATSYPYDVSVVSDDGALSIPWAEGDANGSESVYVDMTGHMPGELVVSVPSVPFTSAAGAACNLTGEYTSISWLYTSDVAKFAISAPAAGDLTCTLFALGFAGDTEYFGIVGETSTGTDSGDASVTTNSPTDASDTEADTSGPNVSVLPATGTGHAPTGMPLDLAGLGVLLGAGAFVLRRRFAML